MPLTLKATTATWLKRYPIQAASIQDADKRLMGVGDTIQVNWFTQEGVHLLVEVTGGIGGRFNWYAFQDHVEVWDGDKRLFPVVKQAGSSGGILLKVPFFAQLATPEEPTFKTQWEQNRTCFTSAMSGALTYLGAKLPGGDDQYYKVVQRYGDTTDWNAQINAAVSLGIKCYQRTNADFADLNQSLQAGKPIVIGILHRGSLAYPTGGHMVLVRGVKSDGSGYWVNDSYGSLMDAAGAYTGAVENGNCALYPTSVLKARWLLSQNNNGWAMFF
jgi:hypothetical protein